MGNTDLTQDAEIFRRETAARGGPFRHDCASPPVRAAYDEVAARAQDLIARARETVEALPPIYFDFILNPRINAVAFRAANRYFIGITTGALFMLRLVIGRMLSDRRTFPSIGNPHEELDELSPMANYAPDADAMYHENPILTPRNGIRRNYAAFLQDQAIMFFIGHEIAHISHGHVDYLSEKRQMLQAAELSVFAADGPEARFERQCLEQDADRRSIISRMHSLYVTQQSPEYPGVPWAPAERGPERAIRDWTVCLSILFRLFGDVRFTRSQLTEASYPPLPIRRMYAEGVAAWTVEKHWATGLHAEVSKAIHAGRNDAEEAFATILGTPVSMTGLRQAMSRRGRDHAMRLQEYWNSTVIERVRPYSYEFGRNAR